MVFILEFKYLKKIYFITKYHNVSFFRLFCLLLIASALEVFGLGLVVPYVGLIVNPEIINDSKFFSVLNYFIPTTDHNQVILYLGIFLIFIFLLRALFAILLNKSVLTYCFNQGMKMRLNLMKIYLNLPYKEFYKKNKSEYLYHINSLSLQFSQQILLSSVRIMCDGFLLFVIILYLSINFGFQLAIVISIILSFLILYDYIFKVRITNYGKKINYNSENLIRNIQEGLSGFKEIRILNKENFFIEHLKNSAEKYASFSIKNRVITHAPRYLLDFVVILAVFLMVTISQLINQIKLIDYIPLLSVFALAAIRIIPSANVILRGISHIRFGKNTIERIYEDLQSKPYKFQKINNNENSFQSLTLNSIDFKYPEQEKMMINNLSIFIPFFNSSLCFRSFPNHYFIKFKVSIIKCTKCGEEQSPSNSCSK